ncbi:small ribosomal subunit protein mS31 [Anopheles ziemanni]|uniref:small ribosomal subunit protein mS31 n=1 Tax=Anopheles coustani TaxID=139045 RepID=UPI00265A3CA6|nr:small ribosomal subunit protein mS31 [Anopheles coustani]XP_058172288.1 small ribosomal subunit protein mS31 [Anopheles ziemanni]
MFNIARVSLLRLHKIKSLRGLLSSNGFSSDSNTPGDGKEKPQPTINQRESEEDSKKSAKALNRLNELLAMMSTESDVKLVKKVDLPRPRGKKANEKKKDADSDSDSDEDERPKDLAQATRKVASALGGDEKKTESELLSKLLGTTSPTTGEGNLTDIITGMTVDRNTQGKEARDQTRSSLVKKSIDSKRGGKQRRDGDDQDQQRTFGAPRERFERRRASSKLLAQSPGGPGSVKLFNEEPLGIFTDLASLKDTPDKLSTWQKLNDRELRLAVTHPPANYFQKMAIWTEQGKLWKFPINNEQGREQEAQVPFTEHVFLEEHLESWCPRKGPIRHFMELVCVGLSKNHYITAQEKRDHIFWFRDYFEQKKDILKDIIVQEEAKPKEIEK